MIALFPNILNIFLSGRVRPNFGNFESREATFDRGPKKIIVCKKSCRNAQMCAGRVRTYEHTQILDVDG